ncbi:MAG: hypothetical protein OEN50_19730 [Deltaproteobacteria bacterium]|nr:hypothetical protein [Deltaproteobacteria bacterium]
MKLINRGASGLTLALALAVSAGCSDNNFALMGRDTLPPGATQTVPDEIVATVERLDNSSREIHLRPNDGRTRVVGYSTDARVMYRGREYPVSQLEAGDVVAMRLTQDSRGNSYTDLIRVQQSIRDRDQSRGDTSRLGIQMVDGRVEQVNFQRSSFEIRDQSRDRVLVSLPDNARRSEVDRFRALRSGDYVRVEGRFTSRDQFELESFLRDNR